MSQLALRWSAPDRDRESWAHQLELLRLVVARVSLKEVAYRLDVEPSALANALAERDRHYVRASWLSALTELAAEHGLGEELGAALVAPAGLSVAQAAQMTPEQRLERIQGALLTMGEVGDLVLKKAGLR